MTTDEILKHLVDGTILEVPFFTEPVKVLSAKARGTRIEPRGYGPMVTASLDATFAALSDPTRRAILARLAEGEATVNELVAPFQLSQPAISNTTLSLN